jgi:hypothetical protein
MVMTVTPMMTTHSSAPTVTNKLRVASHLHGHKVNAGTDAVMLGRTSSIAMTAGQTYIHKQLEATQQTHSR